MKIELTARQFRSLLDLVYIGNRVLNELRKKEERLAEYEELQTLFFTLALCDPTGRLAICRTKEDGTAYVRPTFSYEFGEANKAINLYVKHHFLELLASRMAMDDLGRKPQTLEDYRELKRLMVPYQEEFARNGAKNIRVELV